MADPDHIIYGSDFARIVPAEPLEQQVHLDEIVPLITACLGPW
ncbi:hypothetical protein [Amycolatopsis kentuckyensis]